MDLFSHRTVQLPVDQTQTLVLLRVWLLNLQHRCDTVSDFTQRLDKHFKPHSLSCFCWTTLVVFPTVCSVIPEAWGCRLQPRSILLHYNAGHWKTEQFKFFGLTLMNKNQTLRRILSYRCIWKVCRVYWADSSTAPLHLMSTHSHGSAGRCLLQWLLQ